MPDVPYEELVASLLDAWDCVVYKTGHTRKQMYRKVRFGRVRQTASAAVPFMLQQYGALPPCCTSTYINVLYKILEYLYQIPGMVLYLIASHIERKISYRVPSQPAKKGVRMLPFFL